MPAAPSQRSRERRTARKAKTLSSQRGRKAAKVPSQIVIVTGMSGAGKSSALRALEDLGFETVDNLPVALLHAVVAAGGSERPLAVGIDVRTRDFDAAQLLAAREAMRRHAHLATNIVFLDADNEVLGQRYTESRRAHPLANPLADELPVAVGVEMERGLLAPLREHSDLVIDTSRLLTSDLKRLLAAQYGVNPRRTMRVFLMSFAYRHGLPRDADIVLDVRFLKNPHYVPKLKPKTGLDKAVGRYIASDPALKTFLARTTALLGPLLPRYAQEGKSYLTIAVGCTGGQHRSVYVVERLRQWLARQKVAFDVRHRDLPTAAARGKTR